MKTLAYFTLVVLLITNRQLHNITLPQRNSILAGQNPASLNHPNFRLIRVIQAMWTENLNTRSTSNT